MKKASLHHPPSHLEHLPFFKCRRSWIKKGMGALARCFWALFIKTVFKFLIPVKIKGDFNHIHKKHPRLLIISNHASHLDAVSISYAIPFKYWKHLFISVAKDYWFSHPFRRFLSKYCLNAVPIDRKEQQKESVQLCKDLLKNLSRIWLILFPEGTRSKDDHIHPFKGGVSLFSQKTQTPILFLYIEGNRKLMPKGRFPRFLGKLTIHVGSVHPPANIQVIRDSYKEWVLQINQDAYG